MHCPQVRDCLSSFLHKTQWLLFGLQFVLSLSATVVAGINFVDDAVVWCWIGICWVVDLLYLGFVLVWSTASMAEVRTAVLVWLMFLWDCSLPVAAWAINDSLSPLVHFGNFLIFVLAIGPIAAIYMTVRSVTRYQRYQERLVVSPLPVLPVQEGTSSEEKNSSNRRVNQEGSS